MQSPTTLAADAANKAMACTVEYETVQHGLYSYMARYNVDTVAAATTNNMVAPEELSPVPVRNSTTVFLYVGHQRQDHGD